MGKAFCAVSATLTVQTTDPGNQVYQRDSEAILAGLKVSAAEGRDSRTPARTAAS